MDTAILEPPLTVEKLWISPGHDFKGRFGEEPGRHAVEAVAEIECHAGRGVVGDRYYDFKPDYKGQITLMSAEVLDQLSAELCAGDFDRAAVRRNVLVRGYDLNALIGKTFRLGELLLTGSEECAPCVWMDKVVKAGANDWLKGRGGLRCRIVKGGCLRIAR